MTSLEAIAAQLNASVSVAFPVRPMTDREMHLREMQAKCLLAGLPKLAARYEALLSSAQV